MTQIKTFFSFLLKALSNLFDGMIETRQKQVEAYLARSIDMADFERRMKEIQKNTNGRPGF